MLIWVDFFIFTSIFFGHFLKLERKKMAKQNVCWHFVSGQTNLGWNFFGVKKILVKIFFGVKQNLGQKFFWVKKMWVGNFLGETMSEILLGEKKFGSEILFGQTYWGQKKFGVKKNLGRKKKFGPKMNQNASRLGQNYYKNELSVVSIKKYI